MKWFYDMKIKTKLVVGFVLVALIIGLVGYLGISNITKLDISGQDLYEQNTVPLSEISEISVAFQRMRVNMRDMIFENDPVANQKNVTSFDDRNQEIDELVQSFNNHNNSEKIITVFQEFIDARKKADSEFEAVKQLAVQNQNSAALSRLSETGSAGMASRAVQDSLEKLVNLEITHSKDVSDTNSANANSIVITMIIIIVIGVSIALALGLILGTIISKPLKKASYVLNEMSHGHLGERLNLDTKDELGEMSVAMDTFADNLQNVVIQTMNQISEGDVSANIDINDSEDEITPALKRTIETIRALISEATMLSQAAVAGRLDTRGNIDAFNGGFKEVVAGVNNTLDAVVGPLNVAADYVKKIGNGQIPVPITETYNGDFNAIKVSLNSCIDGLAALTEGNRILGKLSLNDYSEAINATYPGIYGEIATSINAVQNRLTRVVGVSSHIAEGDMSDLDALNKIGKRSENDTLNPSLIGMIENINSLVKETEAMSSLAIEGNLSNRGDVSKFKGEFAKVIEGFNQTLDAIIQPIDEASATLTELSTGNLSALMIGNYQGDHAQIKKALNSTMAFLKNYVDEITYTLEEMGKGNLNLTIDSDYLGDFQAIKIALNSITATLSDTMSEITEAANQVDAGARQISDGGQALSQGTTEQASAIEQLNASIEEVAGETKKNATNANEANERALEVRNNAEIGNTQMNKMISAMSEINESSHNISKIIKVIDDIAFQTNILALNAAVEAARAGQHGKGFAVVAEEVRSLAARSAEAAKETTSLIEGSIESVDTGTKIADDTAESLKEILREIEKVTGLVGNIAQASNDQATEIAQITQGIEQVSTVVQTNSATAEESAAASEELSGQAEMLKQMVSTFRLKKNRTTPNSSFEPDIQKSVNSADTPPSPPQIVLDDMEFDKY
ncbi:methyl-accepting chemotaxis protein [Acetobacterium woodii]|uniref:Methyl-accepting chemotaxis sensory transducer n=1 Tax=Acetobacterium woodii (strain ATCC 29683 / DSM 1030 / JCM 2381 / KCTC 1655 / WB1) TaxID=931626 RepID=H6LGK5_ACEWD|nr:methyl-accepting chemotaxis protein [Acetobacterium woodii]AFA48333.1 methyl-accepting chemotaxis sensory transducer [Acetobacterium woodii DSM 1030]